MHSSIGYCPENPYFYDYLTARELMEYFGELFGMSPKLRKSRTEELLKSVGLDEKDWNKQLRKFSKGMLQRVGLAQSLINNPEIVFMDEPMSGLDPIGRREVRELIAGLRDKGTTVFMSTHILSDVEALCDEVAILRKGKLAASGKLSDLLASKDLHRSFEVQFRGISGTDLETILEPISTIWIRGNESSATVQIEDDSQIEQVLSLARSAGGKLISVNTVKQSLEDLFVKETADKSSPASG